MKQPSPGVRIAPTSRSITQGTSTHRDLDRWTIDGCHLRGVLSQVFEIPDTRIELPADLDNTDRYDCSVVLAPDQPFTAMTRLMQDGLERHLGIAITPETRMTDVYAVTVAVGGLTAIRESLESGGGIGSVSFEVMDYDSVTGPDGQPLSEEEVEHEAVERFKKMMAGASRQLPPMQRLSGSGDVAFVCGMLEGSLGRPVLDETGVTGSFRWDVEVEGATTDALIAALQAQTGLVATPARRELTTLVVRHR
jgi:uncharacterized protein (TIGR03435 family)